jgi:hypothetical protein
MPPADAFYDDFSDGLWTKHAGNPVLRRDQPGAESDYLCEPNLIYRNGRFHLWFAQMFPPDGRTALGYATSPDGFTWTKHPANPMLHLPHCEVHRPSVMEHQGVCYCFAVDDEFGRKGPSTMRRWESRDGLQWSDEQLVMTADQEWEEGTLANMAVVVDDAGLWQMLYTRIDRAGGQHHKGYFGAAHSADGVCWTKHPGNPVITGFYGGDPCLVKSGDRYYTWHSRAEGGSLRIYCHSSEDMIHWQPVGGGPQLNYTQPWERGVPPEEGGTTAGYYGHLTDATVCEAEGRVFLIYQGAQTPLGVATFEGTMADLAQRLQQPPLSRWLPSPYGMVEGGTLKLADNATDRTPLVAPVPGVSDSYVVEARIQCYAGATHRVSLVMRHADANTFARFWLHDDGHTYYQECLKGLLGEPLGVGPNHACDADWHDWHVEIQGDGNRLSIDGRLVGECRTSAALLQALAQAPTHIGFGTLETYASIEFVRVR